MFFYVLYIFLFFWIVQVQLSPFSPHRSPPPHLSLPPTLPPTHFGFLHVSFILFLGDPSSIFPHYPSPPTPLVTVSLFFISVSLVIFCVLVSFVDYVPVKGEVIWYSSFTAWLISLSIMLSSSIHAVVKVRSSFFLSAV